MLRHRQACRPRAARGRRRPRSRSRSRRRRRRSRPSEECDEATFFVEQGLFEEAREILETVLIAYPDHRARDRADGAASRRPSGASRAGAAPTARNGSGAGDGGARRERQRRVRPRGRAGRRAGRLRREEPRPARGAGDDYQVSVDEVFAEFKKGLEKVVKPEDVDTHYDLGIAYKEMGLIDDAIGEFTVARKGCLGKRKEIDCLTMIGLLQLDEGRLRRGDRRLSSRGWPASTPRARPRRRCATSWACAYEAAGRTGKALGQFLKVQALDGELPRRGAAWSSGCRRSTTPEDDAPAARLRRSRRAAAAGQPRPRRARSGTSRPWRRTSSSSG